MLVVGFDAYEPAECHPESMMHVQRSSLASLLTLHPHQRPYMIWGSESMGALIAAIPRTILAARLPLDGMEDMRSVIDPDLLYELLSKRGLALSTLNTPACHLINLGNDDQIQKMQLATKGRHSLDGEALFSSEIINEWKNEVIGTIINRPLPFVVKLQQTLAGIGTFVIKKDKDKKRLLADLPSRLDTSLQRANLGNIHLRPNTIIISEFNMSDANLWDGASITYSDQEGLEQRFRPSVQDTSAFLQIKGYFGAVGIDIMEGADGRQWIVDLNVRPPGSLVLGLLKKFLSEDRGLDEARLISTMSTRVSKVRFWEALGKELAAGRVIVTAWFEDLETGKNFASLVIAGKDKAAVNELAEIVEALKQSV
ncbi:hypothetical protein LZ554_005838 [Drepanopeziza brunnea f. sp. 'monogermtubi']|nr:hypothetical protein LZ554_005838 [Drepanopeziza brunnea f. sp. 'monogermtubi']